MNVKIVLIIGDGMGDRPIASLGDKTPLEAADTPNMDGLVKSGICGICDPIAPGVPAGSDTAHLAILGYDPFEVYTGRGPFEAAGIGMDVRPGDVAFRCNFATVGDDWAITDRRAGRITEGTADLASSLDGMELGGAKVFFKESTAHRAALVLRGAGLDASIGDVDPHEVGAKVHECRPLRPEAEQTAKIVNEFTRKSFKILKEHPVNEERVKEGKPPANIALPRGAGLAPHIDDFSEKFSLNGALVGEVGLLIGVGKILGLKSYIPTGATGGLDSDVGAIGRAILEEIGGHDFVLANVKGPDVAGHDNQPEEKVKIIERLDGMVGAVLSGLEDDAVVAITADHSTPCSVMDHSGDPVPLVMAGPGVRVDDVSSFGERSVAKGGLLRIRGQDILPILMDVACKSKKFGA